MNTPFRHLLTPRTLALAAACFVAQPQFAAPAKKNRDADDEPAPTKAESKPGEGAAKNQPNNGEAAKGDNKDADSPLHIPAEKREAAGIVLAKPVGSTLSPQVEAYGRVIDPAPLVTLLAEEATSRAALNASEKELNRVKTLFQNGANASAQAVETAEANVGRDRAAAASARLRLLASWGKDFVDALHSADITGALEQGAVLARLDVLPGDELASPIKQVEVRLASGGSPVEAEVLGPATVADPQVQGRGLLVLIRTAALPVNAALRATLPGVGAPQNVVIVPRSAVVYHQGSAWIYVLGEKDTFERKRVTVDRSLDNGLALTSGEEAEEQVVTTGAEQLLASELQAGGGTKD